MPHKRWRMRCAHDLTRIVASQVLVADHSNKTLSWMQSNKAPAGLTGIVDPGYGEDILTALTRAPILDRDFFLTYTNTNFSCWLSTTCEIVFNAATYVGDAAFGTAQRFETNPAKKIDDAEMLWPAIFRAQEAADVGDPAGSYKALNASRDALWAAYNRWAFCTTLARSVQ